MRDEPGGVEPGKGRFQFSLGTLLGLIAAVSLLLGMWSWRGASGALLFCLAAAVCVTAVGVWRRRVRLIAAGILLVAAMLYALHYSANNTAVTSKMVWGAVAMRVTVVDAATGEPVQGATVRVSGFRCRSDLPSTDADGAIELRLDMPCTASRYQSVLISEEKRSVSLHGLALEVEAPGHKPVQRPLAECLGRRCALRNGALPPITVELVRPTPASPP
jgi:hypothetical protein